MDRPSGKTCQEHFRELQVELFLLNPLWKKFAIPWKKIADEPIWYPPNHHTFRNFLPDPPRHKSYFVCKVSA